MKTQCWILILASGLAANHTVLGSIIFSQDFASHPTGPLTEYISATPGTGQWNAIAATGKNMAVAVANGALTVTRDKAGGGGFSRTTDFNPVPEGVIFRFNFSLSQQTAAADTAALWQIGSGFSTGTAAVEANANVHSQVALHIHDNNGGFAWRDPKTGAESSVYSGGFPVTWVINNSTGPLQYTAPNGTTQSIAQDRWDLWYGSFRVLSGRQAETAGQSLTDIKFAFTAGTGAITMDNFSIETLPAVPEPAATGTVAAVLLVVAASFSEWRRRGEEKGKRVQP